MGAKKKPTPKAAPAPKGPTSPSTWTAKAVGAVVAMGLLGGMCGVGLSAVVPDGGLLADGRARHHLASDTAAGLVTAARLQDGDSPDHNGIGALAHMLLWTEHGAPDDERSAAERLLQKASSGGRKAPEALYARALLVDAGNADLTLDDDLKAAPESPWVLLARAHRSDDVGARLQLAERAALSKEPLPHANHQWARAAAVAGDVLLARAALDRLFRLRPEHPGGAVTAVVVGLTEDAALPEGQRRRRPERQKGDAPPRPGDAPAQSPDERRLLSILGSDVDALDAAQLALLATALAFGQGGEAPAGALEHIVESAARSASVAQAGLELAVCVGDVELADTIAKAHKTVERLELVAQVSRARFLRAIAEGERRAASKGPVSVDASGITLPLCTLGFALDEPGLPWRSLASPRFFPERRYQQLLADVKAGGTRERLDERLQAIEKLGLVDRAIAGADFGTATTLLKEAKDKAGTDADVALTEAALKARQGDPAGVKLAVESALAAAPLDPAVLLAAASLSLDVDNLGGVRKALLAFNRLGLKAATASALTAILEARSGDVATARVALAEARRLGGTDDTITLQAAILANRLVDAVDARAAADALLKREGTAGAGNVAGGGDVVAAWVAEAAWRGGDQARAEAALKAITSNRPQIGEAHLFYANVIRFNPVKKGEAIAAAVTATKRIERGPLLDEARKLLVVLKKKR